MKIKLILIALILVISCTNSTKNDADERLQNERIHVETAVKVLNEALIDPDKAVFENIVTEGLSYGHSSGNIQNKQEFVDDLRKGSFDFLEINISDQTVDVFDKTAVVRHILSAKASSSGEPVEIRIGIFLVFQKESDQWKLRARQAYKL